MALVQSRSLIAQEKVVRATTRLLAEGGHEHCTLARVAAESKVAKGSVQHHFKSQDGLLLETYRALMGGAIESWADRGGKESATTLRRQMSAFIDFMIDRSGSEEYRAIIRILIATTGKTRLSKKLRTVQLRALQDAFATISAQLRLAPDHSAAGEKMALAIAQRAMVAANAITFAVIAHVDDRHLGPAGANYVETMKTLLRRELKAELQAFPERMPAMRKN